MEMISTLPTKKPVIGTNQIVKSIKAGKMKQVIVTTNTPSAIVAKLGVAGVHLQTFSGNEKELATKLGKPFPIAAVGYEE